MAVYHATTKPLSRAGGRSAVAAAAYRSGSELTDERTGQRHDYTRKGGIECAEVIMPDCSTADRSTLWNAAEAAEKRKDARTAREWEVALPSELSKEQRRELAQGFARALAERYGVAADCAIHEPSAKGDQRNHHAHILLTTRQVMMENGQVVMGPKSDLELDNKQRAQRGLPTSQEQISDIRQEWADRQNSALERAQSDERVDHRSHAERGIDAEPGRHLGPAGTALQRELGAVRQALALARQALKELGRAGQSAISGLLERFRQNQDNQPTQDDQQQPTGFLAQFRAEQPERDQDQTTHEHGNVTTSDLGLDR